MSATTGKGWERVQASAVPVAETRCARRAGLLGYGDVILPPGRLVDALRAEQDKLFAA
ncbi:hypothetical protein [Streptomyces sp. C]|uniref:hypothetical protein n=1 Tax=Streptomyces sp. C TaxID=253839 RepID=UPI0001B581B6|nr:hypothetical protein [Streptomyces sp. C]